jgi:hypothetical protein
LCVEQIAVLSPGVAQQTNLHLRVAVNSNEDGTIQADAALTLREAIALVNGTLPIQSLSSQEKAQVEELNSNLPSRIEFNLPAEQTTIRLKNELPPLTSPGLVIDGTTQPGYDATRSASAEIAIPIPIVEITPAAQAQVFRGLIILADNVKINGLSLYGFAENTDTVANPAADIFVASSLPASGTRKDKMPPKDVVLENNWLGIPPQGKIPATTSSFGVYVFNSLGTTIRRNLIANHNGSGIITSVSAENLQVTENVIAGMQGAIRLEGKIRNSQVSSNLICGNKGTAIYLFKPEGSVQIKDNQIQSNGRGLRQAAIYLMGNNHQVINNQIINQTGTGVVVSAYPPSIGNIIQGNRFAALTGLSIDLNTQQSFGVEDFQRGDGPNPRRNSPNRRRDTGNAAINAPQFLAREFYIINSKVNLDGIADPGSQVEVYRTSGNDPAYNPLSEPLARVETDAKGKFSLTLSNLQPGERVSAIATDPKYGTSEPAVSALIKSIDSTLNSEVRSPLEVIPPCSIAPTVSNINKLYE